MAGSLLFHGLRNYVILEIVDRFVERRVLSSKNLLKVG